MNRSDYPNRKNLPDTGCLMIADIPSAAWCWRMIRSFRSFGRAERMTSFGSRVILGKEGARFFSATLPSPHVNPPGVQVNSDAWWLLQFVFGLLLSFSLEPLALGAGGFGAVAPTTLRAAVTGR